MLTIIPVRSIRFVYEAWRPTSRCGKTSSMPPWKRCEKGKGMKSIIKAMYQLAHGNPRLSGLCTAHQHGNYAPFPRTHIPERKE